MRYETMGKLLARFTAVMGMSSRVAVMFAVPLCTETPEANSATYHFTVMIGPVADRSTRNVVGSRIRPETWLPAGFTSSNEALNVRNDCAITTALIVASTKVAAAPMAVEPFWTRTFDGDGIDEVSAATSTSDNRSRMPSSVCAPAIPVEAPTMTCSDWTGNVNVPACETEERWTESARATATIIATRRNRSGAVRLRICGSMGIPHVVRA